MKLEFKQFLIETQTITQYLRGFKQQAYAASQPNAQKPAGNGITAQKLAELKLQATTDLAPYKFTPKINDLLANFFIANTLKNNMQSLVLSGKFMQSVKDYLNARKDDTSLHARLNNIEFTPDNLQDEAEDWHKELAMRARGPGPEGQVVLDLNSVGMPGWKWVSLGRGYCSEEGKAAGHCGNAGATKGDNILSLRDQMNFVHLTFIVNDGILGEMKGRGNDKPAVKYHKAVVALLKSPLIKSIRGGGYLPEHNFQLTDLPKETLEELIKQKPDLDYPNYVFRTEQPDLLNDLFNTSKLTVEGDKLVLVKCESWKDLYEEVENDKNVADFSWLDEPYNYTDSGYTPSFDEMENNIDAENMESIKKIIAHELEGSEDFDPDDFEPSDYIGEIDDLESAVNNAYSDGVSVGTENEAVKDVMNQVGNTDNGFRVDFKSHPFAIFIYKKDAIELFHREREEIENQGLDSLKDFTYKVPYHGYNEFDEEAFNERLRDNIYDLLKSISPENNSEKNVNNSQDGQGDADTHTA